MVIGFRSSRFGFLKKGVDFQWDKTCGPDAFVRAFGRQVTTSTTDLKKCSGVTACPRTLPFALLRDRGADQWVRPYTCTYQALFITRLKPFTLPSPVAMSHPGVAPKAG